MKKMTLVLLALFALLYINTGTSSSIELPFSIVPTITTDIDESIPINPRTVFTTWKVLDVHRYEVLEIATIVFGNPKIEWTDEKIRCIKEQQTPEGEVASVVDITLSINAGRVLLISLSFEDSDGIVNLYIKDPVKRKYIRVPSESQLLI